MHPSGVGKGGLAVGYRLTSWLGLMGGFFWYYQRSCSTCPIPVYGSDEPRGALDDNNMCNPMYSVGNFANLDIVRFYGVSENAREVRMDMREMVDKVKKGEPLYGVSQLTPAMQGVAARQSRYSAMFMAVIPWFNFVNHSQHGVDTAKYYQQAERELEEERLSVLGNATGTGSP